MDGWMDGWMDGGMDGWMDAWTDRYTTFRRPKRSASAPFLPGTGNQEKMIQQQEGLHWSRVPFKGFHQGYYKGYYTDLV